MAQLTGFSDPVYAEAYVNVNQYDIVLDLLVVNQTSDTLQNVTLELATLGNTIAGISPGTSPPPLRHAVWSVIRRVFTITSRLCTYSFFSSA